jgi:hypothetical protein
MLLQDSSYSSVVRRQWRPVAQRHHRPAAWPTPAEALGASSPHQNRKVHRIMSRLLSHFCDAYAREVVPTSTKHSGATEDVGALVPMEMALQDERALPSKELLTGEVISSEYRLFADVEQDQSRPWPVPVLHNVVEPQVVALACTDGDPAATEAFLWRPTTGDNQGKEHFSLFFFQPSPPSTGSHACPERPDRPFNVDNDNDEEGSEAYVEGADGTESQEADWVKDFA